MDKPFTAADLERVLATPPPPTYPAVKQAAEKWCAQRATEEDIAPESLRLFTLDCLAKQQAY